jgi:hypothetical protein
LFIFEFSLFLQYITDGIGSEGKRLKVLSVLPAEPGMQKEYVRGIRSIAVKQGAVVLNRSTGMAWSDCGTSPALPYLRCSNAADPGYGMPVGAAPKTWLMVYNL